ncbi:hypothetical protein [Chryseobacterium polytrichastri]|uniref:Lipoprotein n=1 Tax=Chryseobacterium polytrichastri TaxID=1302687 RepID=A0A1M7KYP4_9FLAO|nr:hypothetical protein [Chryseobacterium polytrichastri]SHM70787.1 hypothetical protein SAMN05444267_10781 [Chryseobacterium polytrichastri]
MKKCFLISLNLFLVSCNFNSTNQNREEDKKDAEQVAQDFYTLINKKNKENAFKLISKSLFKVTPKEKFGQILNESSIECGNIKNDSLIYWQTLVIKGSNPKSEYVLIYNVKRDIKNTQEKFTLHKEGDSIKIVGYDIRF